MRFTFIVSLAAGFVACGDSIKQPVPTYDNSDAPRMAQVTSERPPYQAPAPQPLGCVQNSDSVITKAESPMVIGASLTMRVAQNVTVDTVGTVRNGTRVWDLSAALSGDRDVTLETKPLAGQWFASSFPTGQYTSRLNASAETLGILQVGPNHLFLQGMASPSDGAGKTSLVYDKPIPTLGWPLQAGAEWAGSGIIEGYFEGTEYHCGEALDCKPAPLCCLRHSYASKVDAVGELITPYGTFSPVHRVKTLIVYERKANPNWVGFRTVRAFAFVTECFGTVAVISSKDDEPLEEFTFATEVRRLAP